MDIKPILHCECKPFNNLTPFEVYKILQLRNEVFVVEQHCIFQDADEKDLSAYHLMEWNNNALVAYARLLPANVSFPEVSIGRVVCAKSVRSLGIGKLLMTHAIEHCRRLFGAVPVRIGAQLYLKRFYESLGFVQAGGEYLEDGIRHIEMTLQY